MKKKTAVLASPKKTFWQRLMKDLKWNWIIYIMVIPVIVYYIIFNYIPIYGILLAFKEYQPKWGIMGSPWVGLKHFKRFFDNYGFGMLIKNTLTLSSYSLFASFPIAIIFAIMVHHCNRPRLKKVVQMVSYAPNFISTVVICGMIRLFMHEEIGIFNIIIRALGGDTVKFLSVPSYFKHVYVWSTIWQTTGWSAIIFISALSGVDPQLHEAAIIDGATILQRIRHIDIPSIKSTIVMLLIMNFPSLANVGFEKVYLLKNTLNAPAAQVLSTYVYEQGLLRADYGYSTAVGVFNMIVSVTLLLTCNAFCKHVLDESIF